MHFHPHFAGLYPDYRAYGFDVAYTTEDPRGGEWLDWVERTHPEHYEAALATIWPTAVPDFAAYGPDRVDLRTRIEKIRSEFVWATPEFPENSPSAYTLPFPEEVSQTHWVTEHALRFLREAPPDQPIYAHISYVQPHGPKCPPAECMPYVNVEMIPEAVPAEWVDDPHAPGYFRDKQPMDGGGRYPRHCYFADIVHLDHQLGRVLDELEALGRLDSTCIVLLADHGELLGDHGFSGKEERHYDACIRVPLIVAGPGLRRDAICEEMVQLEDICPTILDMAGEAFPPMPKIGPYLKLAPEEIPQLPGRSLLPLCRDEDPPEWRDAAYCESYNLITSNDVGDWARTIRTRRFRYTFYPDNGEQMFDLQDDPDEQHNMVADLDYAQIRQELRDKLMEMIVLQDYPKSRRELFALGVH